VPSAKNTNKVNSVFIPGRKNHCRFNRLTSPPRAFLRATHARACVHVYARYTPSDYRADVMKQCHYLRLRDFSEIEIPEISRARARSERKSGRRIRKLCKLLDIRNRTRYQLGSRVCEIKGKHAHRTHATNNLIIIALAQSAMMNASVEHLKQYYIFHD